MKGYPESPVVSFLYDPPQCSPRKPLRRGPITDVTRDSSNLSRIACRSSSDGGGDVSRDSMDDESDDGGEEDQDAFDDDSGTYMEDILMLRAGSDKDTSGVTADGGVVGGTASGGSTAGGVDGVAGGSSTGAGDMDEDEDEEEFSDPGEDALVDDESTLAEVSPTYSSGKGVTRKS